MIKQLVVIGTAVMTTLLALAVLWQFHIVIVYVIVSLALAATVRPLVVDWKKRGFVTRIALVLLYIAGLGGFIYVVFLVGRYVIVDVQQLAQALSERGKWMLPLWLEGSAFQNTMISWLPTPDKLFEAVAGEHGQLILPAVLSFTEGIGGMVSGVLLIFFLSVYWSINQIHFERLWLSLLPSEQRKHARSVWRTIELDLGEYIRSEIIQSIFAALLLCLGYWLMGSQYPVLLALIGALAWLVPVVGAPLALILPFLIGLLSSMQLGFFMPLYTLIVLIVMQIWVEPRLFKRDWDNPILTLVILLAMADAFGLLGIIVAPPLSAVCQILWNLLVSNRLVSGSAVQVSDLKERQAHLWITLKEMTEPPPPLVISSMERLTSLLEKAAPILPVLLPVEVPDLFHPSQPVTVEDGSPTSI